MKEYASRAQESKERERNVKKQASDDARQYNRRLQFHASHVGPFSQAAINEIRSQKGSMKHSADARADAEHDLASNYGRSARNAKQSAFAKARSNRRFHSIGVITSDPEAAQWKRGKHIADMPVVIVGVRLFLDDGTEITPEWDGKSNWEQPLIVAALALKEGDAIDLDSTKAAPIPVKTTEASTPTANQALPPGMPVAPPR